MNNINLSKLTLQQIKSEAAFEEIKKQAEDFVFHQEVRESFELVKTFETIEKNNPRFKYQLRDEKPKLYPQYLDLIVRLKLVCLPLLSYEEVAEFIEENFAKAMDDPDNDVEERIETRLMVLPEVIRDDLRELIYKALRSNEEKLGKDRIIIKREEDPQLPLIKNWLLDYNRTIGIEKHSNIEKAQYISHNSNIARLSKPDKEKIHKLLRFYDEMKPATLQM